MEELHLDPDSSGNLHRLYLHRWEREVGEPKPVTVTGTGFVLANPDN